MFWDKFIGIAVYQKKQEGLSSFLCKFKKKIYGEGNLPLCIASDFIELLY